MPWIQPVNQLLVISGLHVHNIWSRENVHQPLDFVLLCSVCSMLQRKPTFVVIALASAEERSIYLFILIDFYRITLSLRKQTPDFVVVNISKRALFASAKGKHHELKQVRLPLGTSLFQFNTYGYVFVYKIPPNNVISGRVIP